jgi:hypothetical protein
LRTWSHQLAYLIVIAAPLAALVLVRTTAQWARWVVAAVGALGVAGLVLAGVATANLGIARTCSTADGPDGKPLKEINRPVISLFLGDDDCYGDALGQFQIVGVLVVGLSAAAVRRSGSDGRGPALAARRV